MEAQPVFNASGNSCSPELEQVQESQRGPGPYPGLHPRGFSAPVAAFLATLMALLVLTTVLGNALVILAFVVDRSLRTQGNFFFLNLAIADLLVGGFCIPLYIPYVLTGEWKFGKGLCKLWLVMDYLVCTASVFNIVLISFDRFNSVTRAVTYRAQKGMTRNAVFKMVIVWLAAFLLYGPAIICWEYIARKSILPRGECYAEFYYNWYFLMIASTIEFFTPFISVSYFNLSIYVSIRKRTLLKIDNPDSSRENCEMNLLEKRKGHVIFFIKPAEWTRNKKKGHGFFPSGPLSPKHDSPSSLDIPGAQDLPPLQIEMKTKPGQVYEAAETICNTTRHPDIAKTMANRLRLSRDKRVAKSLAIIVCVFGLCWAPYTLLMIIRAMCHGTCVHHFFYEFSFWLLWLNSAINPALYPLCHVSFRKAFIKLLCTGKAKIHPHIFR